MRTISRKDPIKKIMGMKMYQHCMYCTHWFGDFERATKVAPKSIKGYCCKDKMITRMSMKSTKGLECFNASRGAIIHDYVNRFCKETRKKEPDDVYT